jgi:alpha-N-arabinofuranosidase
MIEAKMTRTLKGLATALLLSTAGIGTAQTDAPATSAAATVTVHG